MLENQVAEALAGRRHELGWEERRDLRGHFQNRLNAVRRLVAEPADDRQPVESRRSYRDVVDELGEVPLPPYIRRGETDDLGADVLRYQTVYAREPGSVAAPTAGLHFDPALLSACDRAGVVQAHVTLHVGAGTFQRVRVDDMRAHRMHAEFHNCLPCQRHHDCMLHVVVQSIRIGDILEGESR